MLQSPLEHQRAALPALDEAAPARWPSRPKAPDPLADKGGAGRDAFFDNAKYLAIVLVAVGHSWPLVLAGSRATEALYILVYVFHMPAFILISGYFSRSFDMRPEKMMRLVSSVAVPYVVFQTAYAVFFATTGDRDVAVRLLSPYFLMWFLMALFLWRLLTPLFRAITWPVQVSLLIAGAAAATPDISGQLSAQRVLQFLPFFVLGLRLRPEHFRLVQRWPVRWAALPVFALSAVFLYWAAPRTQLGWVYRNRSAQYMDQPWWLGVLTTYAMFVAALVLTAGFLAWVPRRRMWFTVLGAGTIGGYLLHGFAVKYASSAQWAETYHLGTPLGRIAVTLAAVALVTVLCTPPVRRALRVVAEPDLSWAFRGGADGSVSGTGSGKAEQPEAAEERDRVPAGAGARL
ncbi:acyltransferase family protein [Streptomyces candidus]|uniref:Fucose 4-O-acetylase-like acetyltransferase n=1 Tax=Streptomyces candidus TaxID=67283 RepID=A0A7X0HAN0_9ACTN|nr:acyltransferase family protein [Streptomyces candidus]MBB6434148.1 fucose 4-O-acetylase-like acetyltransferase [Streptomyces candidus]